MIQAMSGLLNPQDIFPPSISLKNKIAALSTQEFWHFASKRLQKLFKYHPDPSSLCSKKMQLIETNPKNAVFKTKGPLLLRLNPFIYETFYNPYYLWDLSPPVKYDCMTFWQGHMRPWEKWRSGGAHMTKKMCDLLCHSSNINPFLKSADRHSRFKGTV